ncbi:MAG: hypothetical protein ACX939_08460 [Hyphococcus sp.]
MAAVCVTSTAGAHPHADGDAVDHSHAGGWVHENGIGPDPDNDSNPATITGAISIVGDAALAADDPPYSVVTFEPPPGRHGDPISALYKQDLGVRFGPGLTRQICEGQHYFQYDRMCTYEAAPSGRFAAGYLDYLNRPLEIEFDRPVCVVTMAIYPTGGKEGEPFEFKIEGWTAAGDKLPDAVATFEWTKDTVRWRHMAGAYYLEEPAAKIAVSMKSKDAVEAKKVLRYLIDDVAFVETDCEDALEDLAGRADDSLKDDDNLITNADDDEDGDDGDGAETADAPAASES